jgi:hypothetical protein
MTPSPTSTIQGYISTATGWITDNPTPVLYIAAAAFALWLLTPSGGRR